MTLRLIKIQRLRSNFKTSYYYPDFIVKRDDNSIIIVETKGLEDLDVPLKMARLREWCVDVNKSQREVEYDFVFVDDKSFDKYHLKTFDALMSSFI
jgi:type III restriction enzyme